MNLSLKKNTAYIFFLSLFFSTFFWIFYDINSRFAADGAQGKGTSDLYRYYEYYKAVSLEDLQSISWYEGKLFYSIFYIIKEIGINFKFLVFISIYLFFISFARLARVFLNTQNIYIILIIYGLLLFWLNSAMGVVLRQGYAILLITLFLDTLSRKKSYLSKFFIILISVNIHFGVIMLIPLVIFWNLLKKYLWFLNSFFVISLVLYISESWYFFSSHFLSFLTDRNVYVGALSIEESSYKIGFSIYKMAAFLLPILLYNTSKFFGYRHNSESIVLYILFVYYSIVGMIFSGFPYHDRIFLFAWIFSPLLIASFFKIFFIRK